MREGEPRSMFRRLPQQAPGAATSPEQEIIPDEAEVIIIGSGFGGGVAALRLTEAGIPVTMIEKGRKWDIVPAVDEPFCRNFTPDGRSAWLSHESLLPIGPSFPIDRYIGLLERVRSSPNLDILCGSAYGGGSVITGMLSLVPLQHLFEQVFPPEVSYPEMVSVYYPRAQKMLRTSTIPDDVLATDTYTAMRVFIRHVEKAGLTVKLIPTATDWDVMRKEISGELFRSGVEGELVYGNNSGWKNSIDRTYLPAAEETGLLTVLLQHQVTDIGQRPDGRYWLNVDAIDEQGNVVRTSVITCRTLVVCAGCYWTTSLFVRARAKGTLPELSSEVGEGFGNNGNCMYMRDVDEDTGPNQGGPPSVGISYPDHPVGPNFVEHAQFPAGEWSRGKLLHFSLCLNPTRGRFVYDADTDRVKLEWPPDGNDMSRRVAFHTVNRLNEANGGKLTDDAFMSGLTDGFTYHPLGGMVMGKATDFHGRVKGYPRLYVLDGSLIPGSAGAVNPSLTITANAERCIETILAEDRLAE